jgi:bile acid-coenzyme A ligase
MSTGTPIGAALDRLAMADPDAPAVTCGSESLSRSDLASRTNRLARKLQLDGVERGDLVTIALPTGARFLEAVVALWKLGATPQPVSHRLPPAELRSIISLASPRVVIGDVVAAPGVRVVGLHDLNDSSLDPSPMPPCVAPSWKAPTSGGSTGTPKLIVSTKPGTAESVMAIAQIARIGADTTALIPAPLYHNGPLQYSATTLLAGGHVVLAERFDAEETLLAIERQRVTWLYAVPTMMLRILRLGEDRLGAADLSSLETLFHLAAPCAPWLKRAWIDRLGPDRVLELFGATEGHAATLVTGGEWLERPGTVGRTVVGEIRIFDECGTPAEAGEIGEVYARSTAAPTYRYIGAEPRAIAGGWETLGDLGWMDADGFLFLCDRATDMILVGGANVYPAEVEGALELHPDVISACVIGLPDDEYGNVVHAIVSLRRPLDDDALHAHLAQLLAPYKRPRSFERVTEPLRDDTGKMRRSAFRADRVARVNGEHTDAPFG